MDIRIKIKESIITSIEKDKKIDIKKTIAILALESGYSNVFIEDIFINLERAEVLFISDDRRTARFTQNEMDKSGLNEQQL